MNSKIFTIGSLLAILLLFIGCKASKYTADSLPETQLIFGNGGGYAGLVNQYLLLENGQLFEKKGGANGFSEKGKVKKKAAKAFFMQLEKMSFTAKQINQPGNTYQFIQLTAPEVDHKLTWGSVEHKADSSVLGLYSQLMALVKKEQ